MSADPQSVLVAGCGYLGLRCAQRWLANGTRVHAITRTEARASELRHQKIEPIIWDMAAEDAPSHTLPQVDVVLWAVGLDRNSNVSRESIWLTGLSRLIDCLASGPGRFVYVSSSGVYGQTDGETVNEQSEATPSSESGQCCLKAETLLQDQLRAQHPSTDAVVLRMTGLYGPGRLLRRVSDLRNQAPVPGNPDGWLNLVHIDDAARAVLHFSSIEQSPRLVNIVCPEVVTRRQYYSLLADHVNAPPPVFGSSAAVTGTTRGGNKKVTSLYSADAGFDFVYSTIKAGLSASIENNA